MGQIQVRIAEQNSFHISLIQRCGNGGEIEKSPRNERVQCNSQETNIRIPPRGPKARGMSRKKPRHYIRSLG